MIDLAPAFTVATGAFAAVVAAIAVVTASFLVLAVAFEVRERHRITRGLDGLLPETPSVSVVVPGFNEEKVLENCVSSIVDCGYSDLEVILVDDGSTDSTPELMAELSARYERVRWISVPNGGKGAALNVGAAAADGEILLFVDADGLFTRDTVPEMLRAFRDDTVGAVCGSDRPVNLDRIQTKFLALISHVGTGMVRRALDLLLCVPVISGNVGAFRRSALRDVTVTTGDPARLGATGPLRTDTLGEDLELTWRLHRAGYQVAFAPRSVVLAESPSTLRGLWKQRVRWARGLLQSLQMHRGAIARLRYGTFGIFLVYLAITAVIVPIVQGAVMVVLAGGAAVTGAWMSYEAIYGGPAPVTTGVQSGLASVGQTPWLLDLAVLVLTTFLLWSLLVLVIAALLDDDGRHLRFLPLVVLWPLYSIMMTWTFLRGLWLETISAPSQWNKLDRTGVVSEADPAERPVERPAVAEVAAASTAAGSIAAGSIAAGSADGGGDPAARGLRG